MFLYELNRKETKGEADFPVLGVQAKVAVSLDFGTVDVPRAPQEARGPGASRHHPEPRRGGAGGRDAGHFLSPTTPR